MIAIKSYLVLKMFPNKPNRDNVITGFDLLKDVKRMNDSVPQDTRSDITPFCALSSPSHMYENQKS